MRHLTMRANIVLSLSLGLGLSLFLLWLLNTPASHPAARAAAYTVCLGGPPTCDYDNLQAAVDAANDGDVIKVASGLYTGAQGRPAPDGYPVPTVSRIITQVVYINKSVTIRGGYSTAFNEPPDPQVHPTTLNAEGKGRVIFITGDVSLALEGLRLTDGDAERLGGRRWDSGYGMETIDVGGGVYVISATATISNCWLFDNNVLQGWGGGLYLESSAATLNANSIFSNTSYFPGSGLYLYNSVATLNGNAIFSNGGGGLWLESSDATLNDNTISSNKDSGIVMESSNATFNDNAVLSNISNGLSLYTSDVTLNGNTISFNTVRGLFLWSSSATLDGNTISSNNDGGLHLFLSDATLNGNTISSNTTDLQGGGLYLEFSDVTLTGNTISSNTANLQGGGLYLESGVATLDGNVIAANTASHGGGLYLSGRDAAFISANTVVANFAAEDGGGVYLNFSDNAMFDGNVVSDNVAGNDGGGLYLQHSNDTLVNNLVTDNQAAGAGSGLYIQNASPRLLHTTLARNGSRTPNGGDGSGICAGGWLYSNVILTNTILVGHKVGIMVDEYSMVTLESTLWGSGAWANASDWGGAGTVITGGVNLWGDPAFVDPDGGDYHIGSASAARDAGGNAGVNHDIDGELRPTDWGYDLGADEYVGVSLDVVKRSSKISVNPGQTLTYTIVVTSAGVENATGVVLSDTLNAWQRPLGITSSATAGECAVSNGGWGGLAVCTPGTIASGASVVFTLTAQVSPTVTPGQAMVNTVVVTANETTNSAQVSVYSGDCHVHINDGPTEYTSVQAAVDAAQAGDLIQVTGVCVGVGERGGLRQQVYLDKSLTIRGSYTTTNGTAGPPTTLDALGQGRVLYITTPASGANISPTIKNLHITGGDATGLDGGPWQGSGGGVFVYQAQAVLKDNHLFGNTAEHGGGLYLEHSDATLQGNTVSANTAQMGGGLDLYLSNATLDSNTVLSNSADTGGGLYLRFSDATLDGNTVLSNTAHGDGGGLYLYGSYATLDDNKILSNTAATDGNGGGLCLDSSDAALNSNTVAFNTASLGGGFYLSDSAATLDGNTVLYNTAYGGGGLCLIGGGPALNGNLVYSNTADMGGGLFLASSHPTLTNNIVAENQANVAGSGLYIIDGASPRLLHTTIIRNGSTALSPGSGDGSGIYITDDGLSFSSVVLTNTILVSHSVGITVAAGNTVTLQATLWGVGSDGFSDWGGEGALSSTLDVWGDPALRCAGSACITPYHIGPGSAALDAGVETGVTTEVDGEPRRYRLPDLGADEYWPPGALKLVYLPVVLRQTR